MRYYARPEEIDEQIAKVYYPKLPEEYKNKYSIEDFSSFIIQILTLTGDIVDTQASTSTGREQELFGDSCDDWLHMNIHEVPLVVPFFGGMEYVRSKLKMFIPELKSPLYHGFDLSYTTSQQEAVDVWKAGTFFHEQIQRLTATYTNPIFDFCYEVFYGDSGETAREYYTTVDSFLHAFVMASFVYNIASCTEEFGQTDLITPIIEEMIPFLSDDTHVFYEHFKAINYGIDIEIPDRFDRVENTLVAAAEYCMKNSYFSGDNTIEGLSERDSRYILSIFDRLYWETFSISCDFFRRYITFDRANKNTVVVNIIDPFRQTADEYDLSEAELLKKAVKKKVWYIGQDVDKDTYTKYIDIDTWELFAVGSICGNNKVLSLVSKDIWVALEQEHQYDPGGLLNTLTKHFKANPLAIVKTVEDYYYEEEFDEPDRLEEENDTRYWDEYRDNISDDEYDENYAFESDKAFDEDDDGFPAFDAF